MCLCVWVLVLRELKFAVAVFCCHLTMWTQVTADIQAEISSLGIIDIEEYVTSA